VAAVRPVRRHWGCCTLSTRPRRRHRTTGGGRLLRLLHRSHGLCDVGVSVFQVARPDRPVQVRAGGPSCIICLCEQRFGYRTHAF